MGGGRVDYQLSTQARLMGKASEGRRWRPFDAGQHSHAAATGTTADTNREYLGTTDTGAEQSRRQRGQGGKDQMDLRECESDHLVESLAERPTG